MARNRHLLLVRDKELKEYYARLAEKREGNVYIYSQEYILLQIEKKFHLSQKRILQIIKKDDERAA